MYINQLITSPIIFFLALFALPFTLALFVTLFTVTITVSPAYRHLYLLLNKIGMQLLSWTQQTYFYVSVFFFSVVVLVNKSHRKNRSQIPCISKQLILILLLRRSGVPLKYSHTRDHEVALFPSEVGTFPQGAKRSDIQSPSTALPVSLQILPGLL